MSLNAIILFYIIIGVLALISIFLSIVNWTKLNTTTFEINRLQVAIGKKIKDYNFKKKEISESSKRQNVHPVINDSDTKTYHHRPEDQPHIEIVRNVRQEFSPENVHQNPVQQPPNEQSFQHSSHTSKGTDKSDYSRTTISEKNKNFTAPDNKGKLYRSPANRNVQLPNQSPPDSSTILNKQNLSRKNDNEILDIVNHSGPNEHLQLSNNENLTVVLYSDYTKDADFKNLWNQLNNALISTTILTINIDFKHILFLYDKEIEYLETISRTINSQKKSLFFINCTPELMQIIKQNTTLQKLIKKEQNSS